jgi:hypothetical protein
LLLIPTISPAPNEHLASAVSTVQNKAMTDRFRFRDRQETKLTEQALPVNGCRNNGNERQKTARAERKWQTLQRAWKLPELRHHTMVCQALALFGDIRPSQRCRAAYKSICSSECSLAIAERPSSQLCFARGAFPPSWPKGIAGPLIRVWRCDRCEAVRDGVNAARDIPVMGLDRGGDHV